MPSAIGSYLYEIAVAPQMRLLDLTKQNQIYGNRRSHIRKEIVKNSLEGKLGANHGNPSIPMRKNCGKDDKGVTLRQLGFRRSIRRV